MSKMKENSEIRKIALPLQSCGAAANSTRLTQIPSSVAIDEKRGMRIRRINYFIGNALEAVDADGDRIEFGLTMIGTVPAATNFLMNSAGIIDFNSIERKELGVAATAIISSGPEVVKDFASFPNGGLIIHPASLYVFQQTIDAVAAAWFLQVEMYYTMEDLTPETWDDLWRQIFVSQAG